MQGKQAKILSVAQERAILGYLLTTRYPRRDRVLFLLSLKAGLRAKEIAVPDLGHGDRGRQPGGRRPAPPQPRQQGDDGGPDHPAAPGPARGARRLADRPRGVGHGGAAGALFRARRRLVAGDGAPVVPPALHGAAPGGLLVALRAPDVHHARRPPGVAGRGAACATCRSSRGIPAWP